MNSVPVKDGRPCIYRVVRVSGTIRKAEEEAIIRARVMISRARRELGDRRDLTLSHILGNEECLEPNNHAADPVSADKCYSSDG
jgi:ribonuclease P/MRP protein subunit POP5